MKLKISDDLSLPIDAATATFAIIGRKGSGKTYCSGKLVELFIAAGVQTIILDLVGKWWGLRLAADGKGCGIDIPMFGGLRGDIPLEAAGGPIVAEALLESGRSAILDLSQFSKGARQQFAYHFGEFLWRWQKSQLNPVPVHLVIEESQLIVPENIPGGSKKGEFLAQMYGMYEEIIRLGRNYGIGVTMITQRPQSVAKEVLNQAEPLLVFQTIGKHERKAIKDWIVHQGMDESLIDSLPSLKNGQCWFWSPEWLGVLKQIQIAPKWTYDSTATPKVGQKRAQARAIKALDLSDLQEKMKETIAQQKANDPAHLKRSLAESRAKVAELEKAVLIANENAGRLDEMEVQSQLNAAVESTREGIKSALRPIIESFAESANRIEAVIRQGAEDVQTLRRSIESFEVLMNAVPPNPNMVPVRWRDIKVVTSPYMPAKILTPPKGIKVEKRPIREQPPANVKIGGGALRMISELAGRYPAGFTEAQWATMAHLKRTGGTWSTYKSRLLVAGLVEQGGDGLWRATESAVAEYGGTTPSTPAERIHAWQQRLGGGSARMIDALLERGPLSREALGRVVGIATSGGTFGTYLSRLRSNGLIEERNGEITLTDVLTSL